jgi:hypothetical protein
MALVSDAELARWQKLVGDAWLFGKPIGSLEAVRKVSAEERACIADAAWARTPTWISR